MIERRHWRLDSGVDCVLCDHAQHETRDHLFFNCGFAQRCWRKLGITWSSADRVSDMFDSVKLSFHGPNFFEVAACALWGIWKQRNGLIFENQRPSLQSWRAIFKKDLGLVAHRVKPIHKESLLTWIDQF